MIYDLEKKRLVEGRPTLRYSDKLEKWEIAFSGRTVSQQAIIWRAAVALDYKAENVLIRIDDRHIIRFGNMVRLLIDTLYLPFLAAVDARPEGKTLYFALYGMDANSRTVEYIEFPVLGLPAIDPPGLNPKPPQSARDYYDAHMINYLFCCYTAGERNIYPQSGKVEFEFSPWVARYRLDLEANTPALEVVFSTDTEHMPETKSFWFNICKLGTDKIAFTDVQWFDRENGAETETLPLDLSAPAMYRLLFHWLDAYGDQNGYWYNCRKDNKIQLFTR